MSKELSPLEALKELKKRYGKNFSLNDDERCRIIKTALERLELIDSVMGCVDYKKVADFLENCGCTTLDDFYKRIKALEIIKNKRVQVHILLESNNVEEYNESIYVCEGVKYKLTQEEYDLLKEVLEDEKES